jgi:DNA-binding NtrC family response regulator
MKTAQVLVVEPDSRLTAQLEGLVIGQKKCPLRHPHGAAECLDLLSGGGPAVLVLRLGRNVEEELILLAEVAFRHPDLSAVVVADTAHAHLAGLAWDLGAAYVVIFPQPRELLPEVVAGLLQVPT